ncbi:MAG: hypothetical protein ED555_12830 [Allomuricauda sp.]|nr:MAG: hypothetical protein ED555_12830 [Allomuricauda sp.]
MDILSSKWFIGIAIIVLLLIVLIFTGKKSVNAEISINGTKEEVWAVLTNFTKAKEWNRVLIPIEGTLGVGNKIKYEFYQDEGGKAAVMDAEVRQIKSGELINQNGGIPGILTFNHHYFIKESGSTTTVKITEEYRGIMVNFWNPKPVEKAYERLLVSLKQKIEAK